MSKFMSAPDEIRETVEAQSRPFHAYNGSGEYIFISYAHRSADRVYPVIEDLYLNGYNVWYDQGIPNFSDLQYEIFRHIEGCSYFVMFASTKSLESPYVRLEIEHAFSNGKKIICVELKPVDLSIADEGLMAMLKDCVFTEPKDLRQLMSDSLRETDKREPDVFEVDISGGEVEALKDFEYHLENNLVIIDKYRGKQSEVTIPTMHDLFMVSDIGSSAFEGNISVTQIHLPEGLYGIRKYAFSDCKNLKSINIPNSVGFVGVAAFSGCEFLDAEKLLCDFTFYDERDYPIKESGHFKSGRIRPSGAPQKEYDGLPYPRSGQPYAFVSATDETTADLFLYLKELCSKGYNLLLSDETRELSGAALCIVFLTQTSFENEAFISLLRHALSGNIPLFPVAVEKNVVYPDEFHANFESKFILHREDLTPEDYDYLIEIELTKYKCRGKARDAKYASAQIDHPDFEYIIGDGQITLTRVRREMGDMLRVPETLFNLPVTKIGGSFMKEANFKEVVLPDSITEIGEWAFVRCKQLKRINLPEQLRIIGKYAFSQCGSLSDLTIPASVQSIEDYVFSSCALESIVIPKGIKEISEALFAGCENLRRIDLPDSVKKIRNYAFRGCCRLSKIELPTGMTEIEACVFDGCKELSSITLPNTVRRVKNSAFEGCYSLENIILPLGLEEIGDSAFASCKTLCEIQIPKSVKYIGKRAFANCRNFTAVVVPKNIKELPEGIFRECSKLTSVTLHDKLTKIGREAFFACSNLASISLPDSIAEIGIYAFSGCKKRFKIFALKDSIAYKYAKENKLKFKKE